MINEATISYRLRGYDEPANVTFTVAARNEREAFDQAVEALKLELCRDILRLRPWAHSYKYSPATVDVEGETMEVGVDITAEEAERWTSDVAPVAKPDVDDYAGFDRGGDAA